MKTIVELLFAWRSFVNLFEILMGYYVNAKIKEKNEEYEKDRIELKSALDKLQKGLSREERRKILAVIATF